MWEKCREYNSVLDELTAMHSDLLMYLRKKWGHIDGFTLEEYKEKIDEMREKILRHRDNWEEQLHPWGVDFWNRF